MAFQIAEAFVAFTTKGLSSVLSSIDAVQAKSKTLSGAATFDIGDVGKSEAHNLDAAVNIAKQLNEPVVKAASSFAGMEMVVGKLASRMTGLGGTAGVVFGLIRTQIAATAAALGVGTGGLFAIVIAIGAAIGALVKSFQAAFKADPQAQAMWEALAAIINEIAAVAGGPLVAAFKLLAGPVIQIADLFDRIIDSIATMTDGLVSAAGAARTYLAIVTLGMSEISGALIDFLEWAGVLRSTEAIMAERGGGGGKGGAFTGLEEFAKQTQSALMNDDSKRSREALENIDKNGVKVRDKDVASAMEYPAVAI